ncbi:MAG: transposase [Patescibacteria group bacterium]|jgi:REP element-mobilizing transposase RayT
MLGNSHLPVRRSIRLPQYDYAQEGYYFVTICLYRRQKLFTVGAAQCGRPQEMRLSQARDMIQNIWNQIPDHFANTRLDEFIIMPDHFHGIIQIANGRPHWAAPTESKSLADMINFFKTKTTNEYIRGVYAGYWPKFKKSFWQRGYYEHVIRSPRDLDRVREYIQQNPHNHRKP